MPPLLCRFSGSSPAPRGVRSWTVAPALLLLARLALAAPGAETVASTPGSLGDAGSPDEGGSDRTTLELRPYEVYALAQWFKAVGTPKTGESFGDLFARAALHQLGKPYGGVYAKDEVERLRVSFYRFECVSLVETSLAIARCAWAKEPDVACFSREVLASRYRNGELADYASRLHYFTDWIEDNVARGRADSLTQTLGGAAREHPFGHMTGQADHLDVLADPEQLQKMQDIEARLSATTHYVIGRDQIRQAEQQLQTGDVVAFVSTRDPGLLVGHVGIVLRADNGKPHLLHASSYHGRVILTGTSISDYVRRQSHRQGVMVIRPLAPESHQEFAGL